MATDAGMRRRIDQTRDLQTVVTTMKSLAAVNIRHYEQAAESLDVFTRAIDLGLQVALRALPRESRPGARGGGATVTIVVGSDQGMCGRFNEDVAQHALPAVRGTDAGGADVLLAVGGRVAAHLERQGRPPRTAFPAPASRTGIVPVVQDMLVALDGIPEIGTLTVVYNLRRSAAAYEPHRQQVLPLDAGHVHALVERPWPTNQLPLFTMEQRALLSALVRQYMFASLYRALAHSLAGENASRLAAMQAAEKNIDDRIAELTTAYHQVRQGTITEELLDIVSGFRALRTPAGA